MNWSRSEYIWSKITDSTIHNEYEQICDNLDHRGKNWMSPIKGIEMI